MSDEPRGKYDEPVEPLPPPRWHRRQVLAGGLLFIAVAVSLYYGSPWILPPWIAEGPMVQQPHPHGALLVWYTSRPANCSLAVLDGDTEIAAAVESDGRRHLARIDGLPPAAEAEYEIRIGARRLFRGALRTARPESSPFRFLVFGDSGKGSRAQYQLAALMEQRDADFLVHTGDIVYPGGERWRYSNRYFRPYRDLLPRIAFWPSLGNHDVSEPELGAAYDEVFELPANGPPGLPPGRNYGFDYGAARFAIIDSNLDEATLREQVAPWLVEFFAQRDATWRFVVFHHSPYTVGPHRPNEMLQRAVVPAFEQAEVDVVFTGHDHLYCRTLPLLGGAVVEPGEGIVYVVSGAGGARLYQAVPEEERPRYIAAFHDATHSFTEIDIEGDRLTLRQIILGGLVVDEWSLPARTRQ